MQYRGRDHGSNDQAWWLNVQGACELAYLRSGLQVGLKSDTLEGDHIHDSDTLEGDTLEDDTLENEPLHTCTLERSNA